MTENKKRSGFFYGWVIVAISVFSLIVSNGLSIGGLPVFYKSMLAGLVETGSVTAEKAPEIIGNAGAFTFLCAGLFAFVVGWLMTLYNLRALMAFGCVLLAGTLFYYSQATNPNMVYFSHTILGMVLGFVGVMVNTILVSRWFQKKRGRAIGIMLCGTSLGGVFIPRIATPLIQAYGWRTAMIYMSLLPLLILLPAVLFLVKENPADIGEVVDGEATFTEAAKNLSLSGMTLGEALKSPLFWIFSICAACLFYPIFVTSQQFILYVQSPRIGVSETMASYAQSGLFACSLIGKFLFGWLCDKTSPTRVFLGCCTLMFLASLFLLNLSASTALWFLLPFGLGYGGTFVLLQLLSIEYFGLKEAGKIIGAITIIETIGGALGNILTAKFAAADSGDYQRAFYGVIVACGIALLMTILVNFIVKPKLVTA
jgi:MFS family permease